MARRVYTYPSRRKNPLRKVTVVALIAMVSVVGGIWWYVSSPEETDEVAGEQQMVSAETEITREVRPAAPGEPVERGAGPVPVSIVPSAVSAAKVEESVKAGEKALKQDKPLEAQVQLSAAVQSGASGDQADRIRARLVQLANEVVFSPGRVSGDPRTATYVVKKGDTLRKIAKAFKITDDLIARINNLRNKSMIRQGARLKVLHGPCHAIVYKSDHRMDVYLGDVLIRTYEVGLGEHNSTPTGTWRVKNKLRNPTYFPPRGGKIISADDPENPLGEHWLGLEGVSGEAKDQLRYGIHGTNEPESIGKDSSLGCVRLHNEDVAELFTLLVIKDSTVVVK